MLQHLMMDFIYMVVFFLVYTRLSPAVAGMKFLTNTRRCTP